MVRIQTNPKRCFVLLEFPLFQNVASYVHNEKKNSILFAVSLEKRPNLSITKLECTKGQVDI